MANMMESSFTGGDSRSGEPLNLRTYRAQKRPGSRVRTMLYVAAPVAAGLLAWRFKKLRPIMTSLATHREGLVFSELKQLCALTDGNLSRHLDVLKEAGIVEIWKGYEGRRPKTLVRLTRAGRERFTDYLAELERLVKDAQRAKESGSKAAVQRLAVDPA